MSLNVLFVMGSPMFSTSSRKRKAPRKHLSGSCPGVMVVATVRRLASNSLVCGCHILGVQLRPCPLAMATGSSRSLPVLAHKVGPGFLRYQGPDGGQFMVGSILRSLASGKGCLFGGCLLVRPEMPFHYVLNIRARYAPHDASFLVPVLE